MAAWGGFLGSGGKEIKQDSHANDARIFTESGTMSGINSLSNLNLGSGKNSNTSLTLVSSDYGAVGAALGLGEKSLAASAAFATDGISMASKSLNDSANLAYDGLSVAGSVAQRGVDASANLAYDGLGVAGGVLKDTTNLAFDGISKLLSFGTDILNLGAVQNLEMLGSVNDFAELGANFWYENAKMSDAQARYAMDYTAKENTANRAMLSDANVMVGSAYKDANRGLLAFADAGLERFALMQNEAVKSINSNAQQAQTASLKALDMVFQSTKSADERTVQDTTKWVMGGLIAVVALVVIAPMMTGRA